MQIRRPDTDQMGVAPELASSCMLFGYLLIEKLVSCTFSPGLRADRPVYV
jgi:hypothetical protein